jgi:catechol 2,3-dioxygenase-like lactoylglutathione lyase family enzyme
MSTTPLVDVTVAETGAVATVDLKLEVVTIPVSDVDRAKNFYQGLGWRVDADFTFGSNTRGVQMTPPGSPCSIQFGKGIIDAAPGSTQRTYLIVHDLEAARTELRARGADVSDTFHLEGGKPVPGSDPEGRSYFSYASFTDPDGNGWLLQEVTTRLPGRGTNLDLVSLTELLRDAETLHGEYGPRVPTHHWSDWYAAYMIARVNGTARDDAAARALRTGWPS